MSLKVSVRPQLLRWARERAELEPSELARRVGLRVRRVQEWEETGELALSHLERLAEKTHTPIGFLFLDEPPELGLPVADFRSRADSEPSPDLLDTIYQCEQRQAWYRQQVVSQADDALPFVGSARDGDSIEAVADSIRDTLGLDTSQRARASSWAEALRDLFELVEDAGILVMRNGVVGNNTHRPLSVSEFRGFALSDPFAPLIFINAADGKAAQMFTVAHELVHIWRGESGVSDAAPGSRRPSERFCNQVAAELLVPMREFQRVWQRNRSIAGEAQRLARLFKVSSLVVLIRAKEAGVLSEEEFDASYGAEMQAIRDASGGEGGDFYRTQRSRLGRRFASAVIASTLEGTTPYTEAFQLLGVRKLETFHELGRNLGVIL